MTAVVAAYEVAIRLGVAVNPGIRINGYHNTGTCGTFAGTVGASKILNLDTEQLINALGLAGTQAAGLLQYSEDGDMSKRLHAGKAASNGVLSALLAQKGYQGPHRILEGRYGFPVVFAKAYNPQIMRDRLGTNFRIQEMGIKMHASCRMTHSPIDAALILANTYNFTPDDIQKVEIKMGALAADQLKKQDVQTLLDTQLSGPFSVALALCNKKAGYPDFIKGIKNRKILELTKKIRMVEDNEFGFSERTAIVEITHMNGKTYSQKVELPQGEPETPFSDEEIEGKFRDLASTCLIERKIDRAIDILRDLENMEDYSTLIEQLVP
jgi:2-methylcitrate dehydratase PrpD